VVGLGKTFQSVCLLWTMLTQGVEGKPTVKRAAVICPTSLVKVVARSRCIPSSCSSCVLPIASRSAHFQPDARLRGSQREWS
jgi:hypothetical protein